MKNAKIIAALVAAALAVLVAWQNTDPVDVRFLIAHREMSLALLLALTFALGAIAGFSLGLWTKRGRRRGGAEG